MTSRNPARHAARILIAAAFLSIPLGAAAQPDAVGSQPFSITMETRLGILENRLTRLENDVARLGDVPTSLARIEEKLTALTERAAGSANILESLGTGVVMSLITFIITRTLASKKTDTKP